MGTWCNCIECVGEQWEPTEEEAEAIRRLEAGEKPTYSTGICGSLTCGYGKLDENGYWEFPIPMHLTPNAAVEARR
jgi:hypothetical protein